MELDWIQVRRISTGVAAGFLCGAVVDSYFFAQTKDRVVTEYIQQTKTVEVEKEKIVWKIKEVQVEVKVAKEEKKFNRYTESLPDGTVRLWEQSSSTLLNTEKQSSVKEEEKSLDRESSKETASTTVMKQTQEKAAQRKLSFGIFLNPKMFVLPKVEYVTLTAASRIGSLPVFGAVSYTYPLEFRFGTIIEF